MVSAIGTSYGVASSVIATNQYVEKHAYTILESTRNMVNYALETPGTGFLERQVMAQAGVGGLIDKLA